MEDDSQQLVIRSEVDKDSIQIFDGKL